MLDNPRRYSESTKYSSTIDKIVHKDYRIVYISQLAMVSCSFVLNAYVFLLNWYMRDCKDVSLDMYMYQCNHQDQTMIVKTYNLLLRY